MCNSRFNKSKKIINADPFKKATDGDWPTCHIKFTALHRIT